MHVRKQEKNDPWREKKSQQKQMWRSWRCSAATKGPLSASSVLSQLRNSPVGARTCRCFGKSLPRILSEWASPNHAANYVRLFIKHTDHGKRNKPFSQYLWWWDKANPKSICWACHFLRKLRLQVCVWCTSTVTQGHMARVSAPPGRDEKILHPSTTFKDERKQACQRCSFQAHLTISIMTLSLTQI